MNTTSIINGRNEIIIYGDHAEIVVTSKHETRYIEIDLEDVKLVREYRWHITKGYIRSSQVGLLHRYLMKDKITEDSVVDHIDRNTNNNKRSNLRVISSTANNMNRSDSKFPVAGIRVTGSGKYRVRLRDKQTCVFDKCFNNLNDAIAARLIAEIHNGLTINQKLYDIYLSKEQIEHATLVGITNQMKGQALNKNFTGMVNLLINRPIVSTI